MDILNKKPGIISKLVLLTLLVFFAQTFLFQDIITTYFPIDDEFALLVNSTNLFGGLNPGEWFTIGFAKYFTVYPEWTPYYQNILRPVVNVVYFVNSLLFGNNYGFYLLFSYLLNGLAFAIVYYLSRQILKLSENFSIVAGILFLLNPGLLGKFYFYPSFAFDLFAAVVAGITLILMLKKKYLAALIISMPVMFLKETMMFLPVALTFTYIFIQKRNDQKINYGLAGMYLLLPFALWLIVRMSFGYEFAGASYTDHLSSPKFFGVTIIQSLLSWPLGVPDRVEVISNFKHVLSMDFASINWFYLAASVFNLLLNGFIVIFTILFIKRGTFREVSSGYLVILTWLLIYYIMLIVLGLETRFGETFYILIIPIALCTALKGMSRVIKNVSGLYLSLIMIYGVCGYSILLVSDTIDTYISKFNTSRELVNKLKEADGNSEKILLVNDISAGFGYEWLSGFIGSDKQIIKVNSLTGYDNFPSGKEGFILKTETSGDTTSIEIDLPGELEFQFEGIDQKLIEHDERQWFERNSNLHYRFPEEKVTGTSQATGAVLYNFGNKMVIRYLNAGKTAIVYFNPSTGSYEVTYINN